MSTLLARLLSREVRGRRAHHQSCLTSKWYFPSIPPRLVLSIDSLIGTNSELRNTVLLGFSKNGKFLIGYRALVDMLIDEGGGDEVDFAGMRGRYRLSLWKFDDDTMTKRTPLKKAFDCALFWSDETPISLAEGPLTISVTELNEHSLMLVHGWHSNCDPDEQSEHFVSLVAPPVLYNKQGWDERCIIDLSFTSQGMKCDGWEAVYLSTGNTQFIVTNTGNSLVYYELAVKVSKKTGLKKIRMGKSKSFDIEKTVPLLLARDQPNRKIHVIDYDVRILAVESAVLFHLVVLFTEGEIVDPLHPPLVRKSTVYALYPATGSIGCIRSVSPVPHTGDAKSFTQIALSYTVFLRRWIQSLPAPFEKSILRLSNESVFSGESLPYLYHPSYPVAISGFRRVSL